VAERKQNICTLCSLGCGLVIETDAGDPVALDYLKDCHINKGALCAKGNYALELLNHRMRLTEPVRGGRALGWDEAAAEIAAALSSPRGALIVEGDMSDEEAAMLASFGSACLAPERVAVSFATNDGNVLSALDEMPAPRASIDDLEDSVCTIAVNDPFSVGPVVAGRVMRARNAARENTLNVIAPSEGLVSKFATVKLTGPVRAGLLCLLKKLIEARGDSAPPWAKAVKGDLDRVACGVNEADAAGLAGKFVGADSGVILLSTSDPVAARLAACCSLVAGDAKKVFLLHDYGNAAGICKNFQGGAGVENILDAVADGSVDTLVVLGADLVSSYPGVDVESSLKKLKFVAAGAAFPNKTTALAHIVLPTAVWLERDGTFNGAVRSAVARPAGGARSYADILQMLARAMNAHLAPAGGVSRGPLELNAEFASKLVSEAAAPAAEPVVASTATRFADGSVTDNLSWPQALKAET